MLSMPTRKLDDALVRGLVEAAPDALLLADAEGHIVYVNAQAEVLFGYPRAELYGQLVEVLIPDSQRAPHAEKRAAFTAASQVRPMGTGLALTCRRHDGIHFPVEVSLSPVKTADGVFIAAAVRDISARIQAQRALHDAENLFRLTFDNAPIGMAMVGLDGCFLRVNGSICQVLGYSREEMITLTFLAITHPDDRGLHLSGAGQIERGEIPKCQFAKRYIRKDGQIVDAMLSLWTVRSPEGTPLYNIAQIEDITERKRAEEALRRSEFHLRSFIEQASDGILSADLEGRYTDVNAAACRLFGYTREELIGKPILDTLAPEEAPRLASAKEFLLREGNTLVAEWIVKRSDGGLRPTEISAKILPDGRWQILMRDISERKRAEEALRRSEDHLARAQRVAHSGSWDWNLRTNQVSRSAVLYEIYGIKPDPKYNQTRPLTHGVHPDDRVRVEATINDAARTGRSFQLEFRHFHSDGSERVLLSHGEPVLQAGHPIRMVGTVMDITERKHLERAREESLRWLYTVLDQCPMAMALLHGAHGERVEFNKHLQSLLGGSNGGIPQYTDLVFLAEHGHPLIDDQQPSTRVLRGERINGLELSLKTPPGEVIPILLDAVPIMDHTGTVQGAVIVFQNITVFKQLDRLRSEWNSVIAHDLRQPVMTISLIAQLLARKNQESTELANMVEMISKSSWQLDRMIGDLLDLSRLEARQLTLECQPVDLPELVGTSVDRMALGAPDRRFEVRIVNEIPILEIDGERISQVTENLLSNALKYSDPETPITIDVESVGEKVTVAITNTGAGITPEALPHLFQRFHRTEDAKRGPIKGIGLGLDIVQQLVAAHGGQVEATSIPGATTTFCFSLPITATP